MLLLGSASFLDSCATTGMERSIRASNSTQEVDQDIRKMVVQSDVTAKSLDSLVKAGKPNLKKSFDTHSDNLANLDNDGKQVLKHVEK